MRSPIGSKNRSLLIVGAWVVLSSQLALCQASSAPVPATAPATAETAEPPPAYEVTTVKPWDGNGFAPPLRIYIQMAFGISPNSVARLIGPEWINDVKYVIQGKPPDSIRDAMQKMTPEARANEMRQMQQSLLADRFKLKVHFETREMPEYDLVLAKGGSKLKESPDPSKGSASMRKGAQASQIKGTALPMRVIINFLMSDEELGGRTVIDKTGLTGVYDVLLNWAPLMAVPSAGNGTSPLPDAESPSLLVAVQEQLGLKLVPSKGPVQVVIIDSIERPSEN